LKSATEFLSHSDLVLQVLLQAINEKVLVGSQDGETSLKEQLQSSTMGQCLIDSSNYR